MLSKLPGEKKGAYHRTCSQKSQVRYEDISLSESESQLTVIFSTKCASQAHLFTAGVSGEV